MSENKNTTAHHQTKSEKVKQQNKNLKTLCIRVPASLHRKTALHRIETGETMTQLVNRLLENELSRH